MSGEVLTIDGSHGEGGGQILRTSLALSLITGKAFRLINIRAGRAKPGLMRQHLTCVTSAAQVGNAEVVGASVGSSVIEFRPGPVVPRHFSFVIGTAGSTSLVLQTVLPALLMGGAAGGASVVSVEGGTHNIKAPPFDFLERVFVPLLNRMGARASVRLDRYGFFPAGGGRVVMEVTPVERLKPLEIMERGEIKQRRATALLNRLPAHIAERELKVVREKLGWGPDETHIRGTRNGMTPGNAVLIEVASEHVTEMFSAIGEVGKLAEDVAAEATTETTWYLQSGAPVGVHLADQLMLLLALAGGGRYLTQPLTLHSRTNIETIGRFLDVRIGVEEADRGNVVVRVGG